MTTKLCFYKFPAWTREEGPSLDQQIAEAVAQELRAPDEIHFSSGQTTSNGGQNYHVAALLVWR